MPAHSSNDDLHPESGARFVFLRTSADPLAYGVNVFLPKDRLVVAQLEWPDGKATLRDLQCRESGNAPVDIDLGSADAAVAWAHGEALKLARVLRTSRQARLTRWRG